MKNKKSKKTTKVFVGMSGGVDSSVAAYLLKKQGYDVTGIFIKCFNIDGCAERDAEDARRVAEHLGIPFHTFDFEKEYKKRVVEYMIDGYKNGITPNPDVMCNKEIKFGMFLDRALSLGADYVATGHYVRLREKSQITNNKLQINSKSSLWIARDTNKDQSYFLWTLTQDQLKHSLFPIGDYTKPQVRDIAKKVKLPTAEKKDSQGICFLGDISVSDFLESYIKSKKGKIVTVDGDVIGEHKGAEFYTIGQRHLGISNIKYQKSKSGGNRKPYYVVSKDVKKNIVVVAEGSENIELFKKEVGLINVHFINTEILNTSVLARVRYRQPTSEARIIKKNKNEYALTFKKPQKFIAPGQSAVFYTKKMEMLGGGIIKQ